MGHDKKTKIFCTMGPACWDVPTITSLIDAGMNTARLNFSHGDHAAHGACMDRVKEAAALRPGAPRSHARPLGRIYRTLNRTTHRRRRERGRPHPSQATASTASAAPTLTLAHPPSPTLTHPHPPYPRRQERRDPARHQGSGDPHRLLQREVQGQDPPQGAHRSMRSPKPEPAPESQATGPERAEHATPCRASSARTAPPDPKIPPHTASVASAPSAATPPRARLRQAGSIVELTTDYSFKGDETKFACTYDKLPTSVKPGSLILIADGSLVLVRHSPRLARHNPRHNPRRNPRLTPSPQLVLAPQP